MVNSLADALRVRGAFIIAAIHQKYAQEMAITPPRGWCLAKGMYVGDACVASLVGLLQQLLEFPARAVHAQFHGLGRQSELGGRFAMA